MIESDPQSCALRPRKTDFVEIFRTTPPKTVCPNFYVLMHANGCLFSPQCSYCYLKSSFWYLPQQQAFSNVQTMLDQVSQWISQDDLESYVLNTGNLSDSLVFEPIRPVVPELVELFRREAERKRRPHELLLVTKGGMKECAPLLSARPCGSVIVSFSVNSRQAARMHESGAAAVEDRLAAARALKERGWRIRMRIDPMILGFDYAWTIEQVRLLGPERLTLGTLRAEPNLEKFTSEGLFDALEQPAERKALARYPRPQRMAIYRQVVEALRGLCPIGLCEETLDVWEELGLDADSKCCNCAN